MSKNKYMMATKAYHKLGEMSSETPDLCQVHSEDSKNYIGAWETGFGFFDVKFPKETTRELTEKEKEEYTGKTIMLSGVPVYQYKKEDFEDEE